MSDPCDVSGLLTDDDRKSLEDAKSSLAAWATSGFCKRHCQHMARVPFSLETHCVRFRLPLSCVVTNGPILNCRCKPCLAQAEHGTDPADETDEDESMLDVLAERGGE